MSGLAIRGGLLASRARWIAVLAALFAIAPVASCSMKEDPNALLTATADGRDWPAYGRLYDEQHYSPLDQINTQTVGRLGLAWWLDLPEATSANTAPVQVGGTIFLSYGLSVVHAVDAVSGKLLWRYDPKVAGVAGDKLKVAWGIRGIAYWDGLVFTGTQDGRLIALDAKTGEMRWSQATTAGDDGRYITGAPRVFDGKVIIGHGGADFSQIRGYVTAYDAATGRQLWRFYTVPGDPAKGFENETMAMAAKTWTGQWWRYGGGGTVWNAITYDPKFDRVYIGTGNGQPWNRKIRSPGGGDNLFLCSIVALDAKTGKYVWHYQTNPGETWDYNSAMDITLADLNIGGKERPVILHAPKNGFLYVIDRETGKLLSAEKIAHANWASRIDLKSGRPVENPEARYPNGEALVWPYPGGAHPLYPMSFSPRTRLLYIPVIDVPAIYTDRRFDIANWKPLPRAQINGAADIITQFDAPGARGAGLLAWDPVRQKEVWWAGMPGFANAGTMATAGDLVFQGRGDGKFIAYDARSGKPLWQFDANAGIMAQPITFERNGVQYVTLVVGYGGAGAMIGKQAAQFGWDARQQQRRLLTFALDAKAQLPRTQRARPALLREPRIEPNAAVAVRGATAYAMRCLFCHGADVVAGGAAPDLRASAIAADPSLFAKVVREGMLVKRGMPQFDEISPEDTEAIRHYIRTEAQK